MRASKKRYFPPINIEYVIKSRLAFQTTQRALAQLNLSDTRYENLTSKQFASQLKTWNEEQKKEFFSILGGKHNLKTTEDFFNQLA